MQDKTFQLSSRNKELSAQKLPIMHLIGNSWDSVSWSGFCVKTDTVPRLPSSSEILRRTPGFKKNSALKKSKISKLKGVNKAKRKNPIFPATCHFKSSLSRRWTGE